MRTCVLVGIGMMVLALSQLSAEDQAAAREKETQDAKAVVGAIQGVFAVSKQVCHLLPAQPKAQPEARAKEEKASPAAQTRAADEAAMQTEALMAGMSRRPFVQVKWHIGSFSVPVAAEYPPQAGDVKMSVMVVTNSGNVLFGQELVEQGNKLTVTGEDGTLTISKGIVAFWSDEHWEFEKRPHQPELEVTVNVVDSVPEGWVPTMSGGSRGWSNPQEPAQGREATALQQPAPEKGPARRTSRGWRPSPAFVAGEIAQAQQDAFDREVQASMHRIKEQGVKWPKPQVYLYRARAGFTGSRFRTRDLESCFSGEGEGF